MTRDDYVYQQHVIFSETMLILRQLIRQKNLDGALKVLKNHDSRLCALEAEWWDGMSKALVESSQRVAAICNDAYTDPAPLLHLPEISPPKS